MNIGEVSLLGAESAAWKDVVRTTCYLRNKDRDDAEFADLLVEIEAIAVFRNDSDRRE